MTSMPLAFARKIPRIHGMALHMALSMCMYDPTRIGGGNVEKWGSIAWFLIILRCYAVSQLGIGPERRGLDKRLDVAFSPSLVASTACTIFYLLAVPSFDVAFSSFHVSFTGFARHITARGKGFFDVAATTRDCIRELE